MNKYPCEDCLDRELYCHSDCEKYKAAQRLSEVIRKNKQEQTSITAYHIRSIADGKRTQSGRRRPGKDRAR